MTSSLVLNERYPHTPEQVWQALTNPKSLSVWLMDNNFEPCVGHRFQFQGTSLPGMTSGLKAVVNCEVIALEPPSRLVYTWQAPGMSVPSIVTWLLTPIEGGTQLRLHHSGMNKSSGVNKNRTEGVASLLGARSCTPMQTYQYRTQQRQAPSSMLGCSDICLQPIDSVVAPMTFLEMAAEDEWRQRLQEALPCFLNQLVMV